MPILQPDLPKRPWEKIGSDIFEYNGKRYLMIVDYYSRFIIVKFLPDIRAETVSNAFIEVLMEYGLPSIIMADCGTQYTSDLFKNKCKDSGIQLIYSSPYHHQSNSLAERSIGIVKSLWRKEGLSGKSKSTALWMHRITPIDSNTPSPYELLFGRKPRSLLPCSDKTIASLHPDTERHQEVNLDARRSKPITTTKKLQATYANYSQVNQLMCLTLYREPGNQQLSSDASANEPTSFDAIHASTLEHVNTFALASTTSQTTFFQWFNLPRCFQEHNPLQFAIHLKTQNHRRHSPTRTLLLNHQQHLHPLSQPHKQTIINPSELALVEL